MDDSKNKHQPKNSPSFHTVFYQGQLLRLVLQVVLGLTLLTGGIILLALRIAGWSMIFGIPMVVISSVFIIYTYDDVLNRHLDLHEHEDIISEKEEEG